MMIGFDMGVISEHGFNTFRTYVVFVKRRDQPPELARWYVAGHSDDHTMVRRIIINNVCGNHYKVIDYSIDFHDGSALVDAYGSDVTEQFK
jgi:hypothetical protein